MAGKPKIGKVLVVEDEALVALATEETLLDAGASKVTLVSTTEEALLALKSESPDVVVLDVHLADRDDGWTVAELVSAFGPRAPKIVFATGAPDAIPPEIAKMGKVLAKPYLPEELVSAVMKKRPHGLLAGLRK